MNPVALYDALNCASLAALCLEDGGTLEGETALLEAGIAAAGAFPAGSREAEALNTVLAAVASIRPEGVPA